MKTKKKATPMKNKRRFFSKKKSDNRGIHIKGKWKSVELDPSLFSGEGMDGLTCFEELTDYSLVDSEKLASNLQKEKKRREKARKRKSNGGDGDQGTSNASENPSKKKKKKIKEDAQPEDISVDADGDDQLLVSEDKAEDGASREEGSGGADSKVDTQSEVETKIDKTTKKKKKKKAKAETVPESKVEVEVVTKEQQSQDKPKKLPKNGAKNWTNAAMSGNQNTDVSAWKDLFVPEPVLKALSYLGFSSPTPIQALALPSAIRDRMDIVGAAETGSGKTLSFAIPMIHTILEWKKGSAEQDGADEANSDLETESPDVLHAKAVGVAESVTEQEPNTEATEEEKEEEDDDDDEDLAGQDEDDVPDDPAEDESESDVENDNRKMGCVKVIHNVEFDFEITAEAEDKNTSGGQYQPLLGLVLTPTRELAVQVKHHIDAVAQFTDIKTAIIVGGMSQAETGPDAEAPAGNHHCDSGTSVGVDEGGTPTSAQAQTTKADRMVERGHFAELEGMLEMLSTTYFNPKRQMFVFSATLTMAPTVPLRLMQKRKRLDTRSKLEILMQKVGIKSKPKVIDLTRKEATVETLTETQIRCVKDDKDFFLYYFLLQYPGRTMVFANSIDCIKRLNCLLVILDCTPLPLHANMHQKQRLKNLERFAERESCVLLTTDVAARGLDIPNVQHVIHYQVPRTSETYVHRSGRTARATKEGLSLLLVSPDDMLNFKKIYRSLGKDEEEVPMFPIQTKCMDAIKERVKLARQIEKIEFHNSKEKSHNSWFIQAAEALEVDLDDDVLMGRGRDEHDDRQQQKMVKGMKMHLKDLISQPVFKNDIKTKYPTQMGKLSLPVMPRAGVETAITSVAKQRKKQRPKKAKQQQH
ncbi:hypothetical protein CRUP_036287 [Coryphaenoides rupestris]|nr:hypothetical protein CRUP_036287 [Coryphaenoides rupestris]